MVALGAHRPHTEEENIIVCGASVCHRVRIYQHNARDKEGLAYNGVTSRGVEAWTNKKVMEADRIILTGGIVYHLMAGFGAGRKAVMPGISGYETIQANHRFVCTRKWAAGSTRTACPAKPTAMICMKTRWRLLRWWTRIFCSMSFLRRKENWPVFLPVIGKKPGKKAASWWKNLRHTH